MKWQAQSYKVIRYKVFNVFEIKIVAFRFMTLCYRTCGYQCFEGTVAPIFRVEVYDNY
jgi:hypothetical protein